MKLAEQYKQKIANINEFQPPRDTLAAPSATASTKEKGVGEFNDLLPHYMSKKGTDGKTEEKTWLDTLRTLNFSAEVVGYIIAGAGIGAYGLKKLFKKKAAVTGGKKPHILGMKYFVIKEDYVHLD